MHKKFSILVMALFTTLLLWGCTTDAQQTTKQPEKAVNINETAKSQSLGLYKTINHYKENQSQGIGKPQKLIFSMTYESLLPMSDTDIANIKTLLAVSRYPELTAAFDRINESTQDILHRYNKRASIAKNASRDSGFSKAYDNSTVLLCRADAHVLSFIRSNLRYDGVSRPNGSTKSFNYDTETGSLLSLGDVCQDSKLLTQTIIARLHNDYPNKKFSPDMEQKVEKQLAENRLEWVFTSRGITFYFNVYEIAPRSEGSFNVSIMFDEKPELFVKKYINGASSYATYLSIGKNNISLKDDSNGHSDEITLSTLGGHSNKITGLKLELNSAKYEDSFNNVIESFIPVHIHTKDGRNYLYLDCAHKNDSDRELRIYDLNGSTPSLVKVMPNTLRHKATKGSEIYEWEWLITNPESFYLDDIESAAKDGKVRSRIAHVSKDGTPAFD